MIKHYVKIAFRNLAQQKVLTGINILGLSIGIACFSLFLLYAVHEFSYDRFHTNANRIHRVIEWWEGEGREPGGSGSIPTPLTPALKKDFPDVEYAARTTGRSCLARVNENVFHSSITFADGDFFKIFSFPLLYGDARTALNDPRHIVITKEKAFMLFGSADVVGKTVQLKIDSTYEPFTISGVAENIPINSSVKFQMLGN
ncbi:MAG TPA: ABC transporter permease, partial [Niastella sp.]